MAPVARKLHAAHPLEVHFEAEAASAGSVRVVKLNSRLVEPKMQHSGLERGLLPGSGRNQ